MSRTEQRPFTMKRAAINLLQVSAAYFAIGGTPIPTLGPHHSNLPGRPFASAHRIAAGAWPMIGLPIPAPRKPGTQDHVHIQPVLAANDAHA